MQYTYIRTDEKEGENTICMCSFCQGKPRKGVEHYKLFSSGDELCDEFYMHIDTVNRIVEIVHKE